MLCHPIKMNNVPGIFAITFDFSIRQKSTIKATSALARYVEIFIFYSVCSFEQVKEKLYLKYVVYILSRDNCITTEAQTF